MRASNRWLAALAILALAACAQTQVSPWHLKLSHTAEGVVTAGSRSDLIDAVRNGCQLRIAWGARRRSDPNRTIEHVAEPVWVSVRDGAGVEVQLDAFMINLAVLGEPPGDHPARDRFGGTERAVSWRANLHSDGRFDAVWFDAATGDFIARVPQRHPMRWFANCPAAPAAALFPE
ncbi:MAG: hypothetical protein AAGH87_01770 [Pseudomonadota bacterium]